MKHQDIDASKDVENDDNSLIEDDEINMDEAEDKNAKMTASDVRRRIEDILERRNYIDALGEEYADMEELDFATD